MKYKQKISRRRFLTAVGGGLIAMTFFPKKAFSAGNEIIAIRTGIQPGNKTRLVIETTGRPDYGLSYPDGKLEILMTAACKVKPSLTDGTLVKSIAVGAGKITANLKQTIAPIPKSQIMIMPPSGKNKYRLVLDFAAGTSVDKTRAAAESAIAKKTTGRKPIIVIDPGHGGKDPGCVGGAGTREKDIVLSVSKKLYDRLNKAGYNAYLTRKNDIFLNLGTRADMAQKKKADLFISVHANANPKKSVNGFSVYTLSQEASDAEAQKLADAENAADKIAVDGFEKYEPEVKSLLSALQLQMTTEDSVKFGRGIRRAMRQSGIDRVDKPLRKAPFAVLKSTVPSCLVELGHLSHRDEEKLLKSSAHQNKLVASLISAIGNYNFNS